MKTLLFIFICLTSFSGHTQTIEINGKILKWEDLEHENMGCPNNSSCSRPMGEKILKFKNFIKKNGRTPTFNKIFNEFIKQNGIPTYFLIKGEDKTIDPVIWDSRCSIHQQSSPKIFKAMQFFKNNPNSERIVFEKVLLEGGASFEIPYGSGVLLVKDNHLVVTSEFSDFYYYLSISKSGKWSVINLDQAEVEKALTVKEDTSCQGLELEVLRPFFSSVYCKKIWDANLKKEKVVALSYSCL